MRILLVDDDAPTRLICRRVLQRLAPEAQVEEAADGASAIAALRARPFDGVLCDHRMGALTGIDVLAVAAEARPHALRALMTGFADPRLQEEARALARVEVFMEKPMTSREFEDLLGRLFVAPLRARSPPAA